MSARLPGVLADVVHVGLGQIGVARAGSLAIHGLGSCVAVVFWSPQPLIAVMCHVLLPSSSRNSLGGDPGRFADQAIPRGLEMMRAGGVPASRLTVKMAGGSVLFAGMGGALAIGPRNIEACQQALESRGLRPAAADVGGRLGRSVTLDVLSGVLAVRRFGAEAMTL